VGRPASGGARPAAPTPHPPSSLQKRQLLHEQAVKESDRILDVFRCVERLAGLSPGDLRRLAVRDADRADRGAGGATLLRLAKDVKGGDGPLRVDVAELVRALPRHVIGCLLAGQPAVVGGDAPPSGARAEFLAAATPFPAVTSACPADHAGRCLRLLAALAAAADSSPVFAPAADAARGGATRGAAADAAALAVLAVAGPMGAAAIEDAASGDGDRAARAHAAACLPAAALAAVWALAPRRAPAAAADGPSARARDAAAALLASARAPALLPAAADAVRVGARAAAAALAAKADAGYDAARLATAAADGLDALGQLLAVPAFYAG
jgi:hypothetical protein